MSAALMAQPGLHSAMYMVRRKAAKSGAKRKRKKNTMVGEACATGTAVAQIDALLYDLRTESPMLPTNIHISDDP